LTPKYKVREGVTKVSLREAARRVIPNESYKKKKLGFPVPIREWIKEEEIYNNIDEMFSNSSEFFNVKRIRKLLIDHKSGKRDNSRKIWTIYTFLVWYQEYFVKR
jgi:asparagine synthase (glutamine-hydrolysing)